MTKVSNGLHSKGIEMIVNKLIKSKKYKQILTEHKYSFNGAGEIDVLAFHKNGSAHIFEYKCNKNLGWFLKAHHQLVRAEEYVRKCYPVDKVLKFYVAGKGYYQKIN